MTGLIVLAFLFGVDAGLIAATALAALHAHRNRCADHFDLTTLEIVTLLQIAENHDPNEWAEGSRPHQLVVRARALALQIEADVAVGRGHEAIHFHLTDHDTHRPSPRERRA